MLDKRTSLLLTRINALCKENGYKIVEERELTEAADADGEGLSKMLDYLEERGYIDVKYADEGVYCLCPLPEGRLYFETVRTQHDETVRRRRGLFLTTALGAFLGGFLGALLVLLLPWGRA